MKLLMIPQILSVFASRMLKSLFPVTIILLVATWWNRKQFIRNSSFWFLVIALVGTLSVRLLYFLMGYSRYSNRYLYTLVVMLSVIAVPGLFKLVDIFCQKFRWERRVVLFTVLAIFCLGSLGKGIHRTSSKALFREMGQTVCELCGDGDRTLISDANDYRRLAYYAGTMDAVSGKDFNLEALIATADKKLPSGRVFIFKRVDDKKFRDELKSAKVEECFKHIKTFNYKGKYEYNLYEYKLRHALSVEKDK